MPYLVCHMEKYKRQEVSPVEMENERDENYKASNPQIDSTRTKNNYHLVSPRGSYIETINERLATLTLKRKIRSDAIYMNSFVLGSDGEFFGGLTDWQRDDFFWECYMFFAEKYGQENVLSAVVHMDETNPHLHLNIVPIIDGKLCSKDLHDRKKLSALQTEFWEKVGKKWGLKRGKEGSGASHLSTAEYKAKKIVEAAEEKASATTAQAEQQAQEYLTGIHEAVESERNKPLPKKRKESEQEISTLRAENAAYREEIKIKNADNGSLFRQLQEAQRKDSARDTAFSMVADMMTAFPEEFDALLDKSRRKKNASVYRAPIRSNNSGSSK